MANQELLSESEKEVNLEPEYVAGLLRRLLTIAVEVDKPDILALKAEDFGDDDVDFVEKFFAWLDGHKEALTKSDIDLYVTARDISGKVASQKPNTVVKEIIANLVINKTASIWAS